MNDWQIVAAITRTILIMSVTGSVIALLLFVLKPMIRDRISKSTQYYLWLVVLIAWIVPFSGLFTFPSPRPVVWIHEAIRENIKPNDQWWEEISQEQYHTSFDALDASEQVDVIYRNNDWIWIFNNNILTIPIIYPPIVFLIIMLQYAVFIMKLRHRRIAARSEDIAMLAKLCANRKVPRLYRNTIVSTPMLIGLFRPSIILPDREYMDHQLRYVLLHELTHLRRSDMFIRWLTVITCSVHWFNPIVWLAKREIDKACELACDEAVIQHFNDDDKQIYGDTLLYIAADGRGFPATLAMNENKRNLKERLRAIMNSKKHTRLTAAISALLIIVVASCAIVLGAGSRDTITFDLEHITHIEVRSGDTGNTNQITNLDEIQRICKFFNEEFVRDGSSKNRTGWGYKLTFYDGENIAEEIIIQSDIRINYDGYFWKIEHGSIPINVFDDLLGEMPRV
jgi:beta-lactamase regulating signal transducer with metallopeptidase domain